MPTPPERCTPRPIWAQEPTVAQVSTIVPSPTWAPMLTKDGISTTFRPMKAPRRTTAPGTARKPAASNCGASQPSNLLGTLSHQGPTASPMAPARMTRLGLRRKDSRIACLSHCADDPDAIDLLGDPRLAAVQLAQRLLDGGAHRAVGVGVEGVARLPAGFDLHLQVGEGKIGKGFGGHVGSVSFRPGPWREKALESAVR